jgi:hypothetical protein
MRPNAERRPRREGGAQDAATSASSVAEDLDIARALAAAGIPVFVAYPDPEGRTKSGRATGYSLPKEWETTTPNPAYVNAWKPGRALVAVMGCGLDLVDIDPRNGGDLATLGGIMPEVLGEAASPSGGEHHFVRSMGVRSRDDVLPGIDVKAGVEGAAGRGFAFIAPTIRKSKVTGQPAAYRWIRRPDLSRLSHEDKSGERLAELVRQGRRDSGGGRLFQQPGGHSEGWTDPDIDRLTQEGIPPGEAQQPILRDVVARLVGRGYERAICRIAWQAIVDRTALTQPEWPWAEDDFADMYDSAASKYGARPRQAAVSDSVSDKITSSGALTSHSDTSDTSDSTDDEQLLSGVRDGAWLTAQQFPPLRYAIPGLIPEGFTLLIGAPKIGKSWLVLDLLLAVASGGRALGRIAAGDPRPVLYLAMEDSDRRMQDRCRQLLGEASIPAAFSYQTRIAPGQVLPTIAAWMRRSAGTGLVVVDTLGKVMPPAMMGESHYQRDYRIGSAIKSLADACPGLAVIVNHHDRKASAEDFIDSVSGTHGLAGAADTVVVLARKRQSGEGVIKVTGRDVPEDEYALTINDGMAWQLAGANLASAAGEAARRSAAMSMSATSTDVLQFVTSHPDGVRAKDVVDKFGRDAYQYLGRLVDSGRIEKQGRGFYIPVSEVSEPSESQVSSGIVSDSESDTVRNEIGPCAWCGQPCTRYGDHGRPLCDNCHGGGQ